MLVLRKDVKIKELEIAMKRMPLDNMAKKFESMGNTLKGVSSATAPLSLAITGFGTYAAIFFIPSPTRACAKTVAVVVPSPASSLVSGLFFPFPLPFPGSYPHNTPQAKCYSFPYPDSFPFPLPLFMTTTN